MVEKSFQVFKSKKANEEWKRMHLKTNLQIIRSYKSSKSLKYDQVQNTVPTFGVLQLLQPLLCLTQTIAVQSDRHAVADLSLYQLPLWILQQRAYFYGSPACQTSPSNAPDRSSTEVTVQLRTSRTVRYDHAFLSRVSRLWNSLPPDVFLDILNLQSFESPHSRWHICIQVHTCVAV